MWALKTFNEKNWRVSLCVQELYHPRDSLRILAAIPVCRNKTSLSVLTRGLRFYLVLDFQHVHLTQILDRNLSHTGLPVFLSHCRLTQLWLVK